MGMLGYQNSLFIDIFPDYVTFRDWYKSSPLSDGIVEAIEANPEGVPPVVGVIGVYDVPTLRTFTLIANEFNDSHSAFSIESFRQRFSSDIYTYYKEFEETSKSIITLMTLTDVEIGTADSMIMNIANIPEATLSNNTEDVGFVSTQQKTINKKGRLQIVKEQLSNKRTFTVKTFINRFRHLFIKVLSPSYMDVIAEEYHE